MTEHPALRSRAAGMLSWDGHVDRLLAVEAALASAQARFGIVSDEAAEAIRSACERGIDRDALAREAADAATPVIPLVALLRAAVGEPHADRVHHGATSQDIIDTATVLQVRDALDVLLEELLGLGNVLVELADAHRHTLMVGRSLLQHASPTTFGVKAAHWLAATARHVERLRAAREGLSVQLGGAVGTLAPFGDKGVALLEGLASELALATPLVPWHTDRDVLHDPVSRVALVSGTLGKVGLDLVSLMQTEIGELHDPGAGGSSAMPHKRNPVDPVLAVASARLALAAAGALLPLALQEHERAAGTWQAEWEAVPRVLDHTIAAAERVRSTLERVEVDVEAMRTNLDRTAGATMAEAAMLRLAGELGRDEATRTVGAAADLARREGRSLADVLGEDDRVRGILGDDLESALDPSTYLGSGEAFIDRVLVRWRDVTGT